MAFLTSCATTKWTSTSPFVQLDVYVDEETATYYAYSWYLYYISDYAAQAASRAYTVTFDGVKWEDTYNINGVTGTKLVASGKKTVYKAKTKGSIEFSVSFAFNLTWSGVYKGTLSASGGTSISPITLYTVSYNGNGATSGTPDAQIKWHGENITIAAGPSRTGYSFQGWAFSSSGAVQYQAGNAYKENESVTLYAIWKANTYPITYNANGGSGGPTSGTKTYGQTYYLSTSVPTRTNYKFLGWSTSASATSATYAIGDAYNTNASTTFYAVWELDYIKPSIWNLTVDRCDSAGELNDEGTYALVKFSWSTDRTVKSISIAWGLSIYNLTSTSVSASGTSGSVSKVIGGSLNPESTYTIRVIVADSVDESYAYKTLSGIKYPIDVYREGKGIAFGKPAEFEGLCDIAFSTRFIGGFKRVVIPANTDLNSVVTPNVYISDNAVADTYSNIPDSITSGTFTLVVESCGEYGQVKQTISSCDKISPKSFSRFWYMSEWGDWLYSGSEEVILYENETGSGEKITLNGNVANYRYIEIFYKDNVGYKGGHAKMWKLKAGDNICLSMQEATATSVMFRQTKYNVTTDSGISYLTPYTNEASYIQYVNGNTSFNKSFGTNYLRIVRVIGRG